MSINDVMDIIQPFLYTESGCNVPKNVTDVKVDPSVKVIELGAFQCCENLKNVILCDGLERIDSSCFHNTAITTLVLPSTVVEIGEDAFRYCECLTSVKLCKGIKRIEPGAFRSCSSLEEINIPSTVKIIEWSTFEYCTQLTNVQLNDGLIEIESFAFEKCTSLRSITIPTTVNFISEKAFYRCKHLERIQYCQEIETFVMGVPLPWWNGGVSVASLLTFSFLMKNNIPSRLSEIKESKWKMYIHVMLQHIPAMLKDQIHVKDPDMDSDEDSFLNFDAKMGVVQIDDYFDSVKSRLSHYEQVQDAIVALETAIMKLLFHEDNLLMCGIIIPNVLPFLVDD